MEHGGKELKKEIQKVNSSSIIKTKVLYLGFFLAIFYAIWHI